MGKVMEKPAQEDESMEVALRRRHPRHDRQPATTKSTSSANVTDTDVHDTVDSSTEFNQEKNGKRRFLSSSTKACTLLCYCLQEKFIIS
ncbi:hypothetical protein OIU76_018019 [Salix suchowensis]|nr:hypothetical protein OIU76_018019 [Salix suchowensis]